MPSCGRPRLNGTNKRDIGKYNKEAVSGMEQICSVWLRLKGWDTEFRVEWEDITMQDETESANARLLNARAAEIEARLKGR